MAIEPPALSKGLFVQAGAYVISVSLSGMSEMGGVRAHEAFCIHSLNLNVLQSRHKLVYVDVLPTTLIAGLYFQQ